MLHVASCFGNKVSSPFNNVAHEKLMSMRISLLRISTLLKISFMLTSNFSFYEGEKFNSELSRRIRKMWELAIVRRGLRILFHLV